MEARGISKENESKEEIPFDFFRLFGRSVDSETIPAAIFVS